MEFYLANRIRNDSMLFSPTKVKNPGEIDRTLAVKRLGFRTDPTTETMETMECTQQLCGALSSHFDGGNRFPPTGIPSAAGKPNAGMESQI
jgi:hypothetical protein